MTSENEKSHGSVFLRVGALVFGLGTLIYTGLEFLTFFEVPRTCMSWDVLLGANPILYMVFVFMQMYYIFVHSRINVNKNKVTLSMAGSIVSNTYKTIWSSINFWEFIISVMRAI